jgi:HD-GYP domain-containing protein (c-di-GMP phosphodiesterase class II)
MDESAQELRVSARGLRVGMWITRLDRPWLETRFILQGFLIGDEAELESVRAQCRHAWVDVERGVAPDPRFVEVEEAPDVRRARERAEFQALHKTEWPVTTAFQTELAHAGDAHATLQEGIAEVMADIGEGRKIEVARLRQGVEVMVDSITRNPSAFNWLQELKRRDTYTYQHALSCSVWAATFARHLGMERREILELALAGLLFDVGKTRVPEALLSKQAHLDPEENEQMRRHVEHGLEILADTPGVTPGIVRMIASHHERHDGSGYPEGLSGSAIPMGARILGVIDTYDALTTPRAHAPGLAPHEAVAELYRVRGTQFQEELVEQFIQTCGIYPTGSLVELNDGRVGVVTAVHSLKRLRPNVMVLLGPDRQPLPEFVTVDLAEAGAGGLSIARGLRRGAFGIDLADLFLD